MVMTGSQLVMDGQTRPVGCEESAGPTAADEPGHEPLPGRIEQPRALECWCTQYMGGGVWVVA
jgi:hypothetical protein